jgi:hypothetical protein
MPDRRKGVQGAATGIVWRLPESAGARLCTRYPDRVENALLERQKPADRTELTAQVRCPE